MNATPLLNTILGLAVIGVSVTGCTTSDTSAYEETTERKDFSGDNASSPHMPSSHADSDATPELARELAEPGARKLSLAPVLSMKRKKEADQGRVIAQPGAMYTPHRLEDFRAPSAPLIRDQFAQIEENRVHMVGEKPVSTFSIDVDSGAYSIVRKDLSQGHLPPTDAVRIEELINYFDYSYPQPKDERHPFSIITEIGPTPWKADSHLVHIGIQGKVPLPEHRPASNLVFLLDVSGSMNQPDKLPLLKSAFRLLTGQLNARDRVSIVVYAGASGVVLEPTPGNSKAKILAALEQLKAGGSTHGSSGIKLAYSLAEQARIDGGINRVILATDGDFNVGTVNHEQLVDLIEQRSGAGISLTTLGFGQGNYNDHLMEQLADQGNGNYAFIDTLNEARKVLVDELSATLETIAKDVKIQVEWNPRVVSKYRLIGYENRVLDSADFNNDRVDAGEIGAGHTVTALYEVSLVDDDGKRIEPLRYAQRPQPPGYANDKELGFLRLRYKKPGQGASLLIEQPFYRADVKTDLAETSDTYRFSAAVAAFGERLRGGTYTGDFTYRDIAELASNARGKDYYGYRGEFQRLVHLASGLDKRMVADTQ